MASSSFVAPPSGPTMKGMQCYYCKSISTDTLTVGWELPNGNYAGLCNKCGFAYETGTFCLVFHAEDEGWRECINCGKAIHCGCIMASHLHKVLDIGGVSCSHCYAKASVEEMFRNWNKADTQPLQQTHKDSTSEEDVTVLFEKKLTASDSDHKNGRLIIPKEHALEFFPEVAEGQGVPVRIFDSRGLEWDFCIKCWTGSKMYVLEGLRKFKVMRNLQPGDTITFYRVDGKMLIDATRP